MCNKGVTVFELHISGLWNTLVDLRMYAMLHAYDTGADDPVTQHVTVRIVSCSDQVTIHL